LLKIIKTIWRLTGGVWGLAGLLLLACAVFALHHPVIEKLDGNLFAIDAQFVAKPDEVNDVVVIKLPRPAATAAAQADHRLLVDVIDQIKHFSTLAVAVVINLPEEIYFNAGNSSSYVKALRENIKNLSREQRNEILALGYSPEQRLFADSHLLRALNNKKIYIAQQPSVAEITRFSNNIRLQSEQASEPLLQWFAALKKYVLPQQAVFDHSVLSNQAYNIFPVQTAVTETASRSLVWNIKQMQVPDILTVLHAKINASQVPLWKQGRGLDSDVDFRSTDWAGRVLPRYSSFTGIASELQNISYLDVLNKKAVQQLKDKVVILGYENDIVVDDIALSLTSLVAGSVYYTPFWADILVFVLLLIIFIYSVYILPKVQVGVGLLLSLFVIFSLLVAQMGMLLIKAIWMPVIMLIIFLLISHALSLLRRRLSSRIEGLEKQVFEAFWMLGVYQYEQGEYDQSFASLQKCPTTDSMLEQMYRIGQAYEKRRQYDKALDLYQELHSRRAGYKAADKRIKSLQQLEQSQQTGIGNFSSARTLIVTNHGLQKPVLGRYELVRELGRGAMGVVYLGKDPKINRQVAIKTMDLTQYDDIELGMVRERFFKEAETAGRLNHPNVVTIYDVGEEQDLAFIAMDYVIGQVMSDFIRKGHLLPIDMVFKLMRQVAIALDYAHKQGVVHRDIKPSNIMYNTEEQVIKVTDFGIARAAGSSGTHTGSILGSPLYMAPEQLSGIKIDGRADLFSLGVSMYQLLTGQLPFQGDTLASLAYQVTNVKHKPIREHRSELPALTTRLINKLLQKDPDKRFSSGKEVAAAIIKVLSSMEESSAKR